MLHLNGKLVAQEENMAWTDDRVATLKRMWAARCTGKQIAEELGGVSRSAVIGKAYRLGLSARGEVVERQNANSEGTKKVSVRPPYRYSKTCQWPIGDPKDEDFGFCGRETDGRRTSYCTEHEAASRRSSGNTQ